MPGTACHFCCMMQPNQPHQPLPICITAIQWSHNCQTLYRGDWIHGKVTSLTIMLQTCVVFEVSLTPIPLDESTIFILVVMKQPNFPETCLQHNSTPTR